MRPAEWANRRADEKSCFYCGGGMTPCVILRPCGEYRRWMGVRIETVELDDRNLAHATSRVSTTEIRQVFENGPEL